MSSGLAQSSTVASTAVSTAASPAPTVDGSATAYPQSVLRPAESEGTLAFVLLVGLIGAACAVAWRMRQQRSTPLRGVPDPSPFPLASPHEKIHDPKYLSRILPDDDSAAS